MSATHDQRDRSTRNLHGRDRGVQQVVSRLLETRVQRALEERLASFPTNAAPVTLYIREWIREPHGVFLKTTMSEATATISEYVKRLKRKLFRVRTVGPEHSIKTLFVHEDGPDTRLHYHGLIQNPTGMDEGDFLTLIAREWRGLNLGKRIHVGYDSGERWWKYCIKHKNTGSLSDHIDLVNSNF